MIMVATDGSEAAKASARLACELAHALDDELLFVTVWRELRGDFGVPLSTIAPDVVDVEQEHAAEVLAEAARGAGEAGVTAATLSRHGDAAHELCLVAKERKPRMIVIGSHGQGMIQRTVFGSVAHRVVHSAPCPVLLVPGEEHPLAEPGA